MHTVKHFKMTETQKITSICAENRRSFRPCRPKTSSAMFDLSGSTCLSARKELGKLDLNTPLAFWRWFPIEKQTFFKQMTAVFTKQGGVHISKFANGDLTWENQRVSKYHILWYVIRIGHYTHFLTCKDQGIVPYGQHLDRTLGNFPPIYGPHLWVSIESSWKMLNFLEY